MLTNICCRHLMRARSKTTSLEMMLRGILTIAKQSAEVPSNGTYAHTPSIGLIRMHKATLEAQYFCHIF